MSRKRVVYGIANYAEQKEKNGYLVDKSQYIQKLELTENPIYLRPRRFGKSMFCSLLHYYYDLNEVAHFDELFGDTWIGRNPTGTQNQYMVLHLNFSGVEVGDSFAALENEFKLNCNTTLRALQQSYAAYLQELPLFELNDSASSNLFRLTSFIASRRLPPLYVIIDEYDNFANHLITTNQDQRYYELTADDSFFKAFFKVLKAGREQRAIANIFITGILPVAMDDLASAFNVGTYLTLDEMFEAMVGFTQAEVDHLLDEIYGEYELDAATRPEIAALIKNHYDGYHFVDVKQNGIYNSTSLMYFLRELTLYKRPPAILTDMNLHTDLHWVRRLTGSNLQYTQDFLTLLNTENRIAYTQDTLIHKFNLSDFFKPRFFPVSFFYLGMLTKFDDFF